MTDTVTKPENITASAERSDAITSTASPRPWRVEPMFRGIADARGDAVAVNINSSDAALIVDAVNERDALRKERDRLRDIVSRLADTLQCIIDAAEGHGVGRLDEGLVREARAAIGEKKA